MIGLTNNSNEVNKLEYLNRSEALFQRSIVNSCNIVCMITAIYFEILELTQFFDNKKTYLYSFNNIAEQGMFIVNCIYLRFRLENWGNFIPVLSHLTPVDSSEYNNKDLTFRYDLKDNKSRTISI